MAKSVHVPFYATGFRGNRLADALAEIAPLAIRYGAKGYRIHRGVEDAYKFLTVFDFDDKDAWEAFWYGPEFSRMRAVTSGWYQVPLLYTWSSTVAAGEAGGPSTGIAEGAVGQEHAV